MNSSSKKLLDLFSELNHYLNEYSILCSKLKTLFHFKEDITDKDLSRKKEIERNIKYTKNTIIEVMNEIDEYFNEGYFSEMDEETVEEINSEYLEICNHFNSIKISTNFRLTKKFPELIKDSEDLFNCFENLKSNIRLYNNTAVTENWSFKIIDPKEADKYLKTLYTNISI